MSDGNRTSLALTHVVYDASSTSSFALALITLTPILLMAAYAALVVQTRELTIINMWAGQLLCEGLNWVLKRIVKQERPSNAAYGYGFPSSHSQYMGFFASFLMCHLYFRHRFTSTGYRIIDFMWRILLYLCFSSLAGAVAYSRFYLAYHSLHQITWGFLIGVALGVSFYIIVELLPMRRPSSVFGRTRVWLMQNQLSTWLELRDGWSVWHDGGREEEWRNWRSKWELLNCKENERRKAK